jgi:hypothetical protein
MGLRRSYGHWIFAIFGAFCRDNVSAFEMTWRRLFGKPSP